MSQPLVTNAVPRRRRNVSEWKVFIWTVAVCCIVATVFFAWLWGPAYLAYWKYQPQPGDIVFQSLPPSRLVNMIEGVSQSPYSHCGIVSREGGRWVVIEAYNSVEITPLKEFVFRGRGSGFAVYRLRAQHQHHVEGMVASAQKFVGRPYDSRYRMDDERIYCSELIFKCYLDASGEELGRLVALGELDWKPFEGSIRYFENGPVPVERPMIVPCNMASAPQLELVSAFNIRAYEPQETPQHDSVMR